jgi:hypothetical protein
MIHFTKRQKLTHAGFFPQPARPDGACSNSMGKNLHNLVSTPARGRILSGKDSDTGPIPSRDGSSNSFLFNGDQPTLLTIAAAEPGSPFA